MRVYYTISTVDSPEYKCLICGRTNDIARLLQYVSHGHSLAIFGERRIGKTSLLYLTRDIINRSITTYQNQLIDNSLKNAITNLKNQVSGCMAVYMSLQALPTVEDFAKYIYRKVQDDTPPGYWNQSSIFLNQITLSETFKLIDSQLKINNDRLIILIDEIEDLLENSDSQSDGQQVFKNIRDIIQSCPRITFVLAGAEYWYKQIKNRTSPVVNNVTQFYLKSPESSAVENSLIKLPLSQYIPNSLNLYLVTKAIMKWTEGKAYYVQAACQIVTEFYASNQQLTENWQDEVENEIHESTRITLDYFYENENLDNTSKQILALIANKPGLKVKEISQILGHSSKKISDLIQDLELLEQVSKQVDKYYIVGTLIESWGKKTQDIPKNTHQRSQIFKLMSITFMILLILLLYFYTNPKTTKFDCTISEGKVVVEVPSSLEADEKGKAKIKFINTSSAKVDSIVITLKSDDIEYKENKTNRLQIKSIDTNEENYREMSFVSTNTMSSSTFKSQVIVTQDNKISNKCNFEISVRRLPIKKNLVWINPLLMIISGFFAKENLFKIATNVIPNLFDSEKSKKK